MNADKIRVYRHADKVVISRLDSEIHLSAGMALKLGVVLAEAAFEVITVPDPSYDVFEFTNTTGGVVVAPLATANDLNNTTGTHT